MTKRLIGLFIIFAMLFGNTAAFAAPIESGSIGLYNVMTKKTEMRNLVLTMLDGKELSTEITGFTSDLKGKQAVYVPISVIFRELGATVNWSSKTKKLSILYKSKPYELTIGKNTIKVNGQTKNIKDGFSVMLMKFNNTERVMAPASVISDFMGMEAKFLPETRTLFLNQPLEKIMGVNWDGNSKFKQIRVKTSKEIKTTSYAIDGTEYGGKSMIIVEFQNSIIGADIPKTYTFNDPEIVKVELVNPGKTPPRVRLEVETIGKKGVYSYYDKVTGEQVVQFINTIQDITMDKQDNVDALVIRTGVESEVAVKYLEGKVVLDFLNTRLIYNKGVAGEKIINAAGITKVTYSQFDPTYEYQPGDLVSRVVLSYSGATENTQAFIRKDAGRVMVFLSGDPNKGIAYSKTTNATAQIDYAMNAESIVLKELKPDTNEVVLKVPKATSTLAAFSREYNDNIIKSVEVNETIDPENYQVTVKMEQGTVVEDRSIGTQVSLSFVNQNIANSNNQRKLIVLDAGHGGNDPGAIGKFTGVKEKDLTLQAVLMLKQALEKMGYEVALTRSDDYRVELYQRTDFANEINATAFVSIHYNAADNIAARGVEILYNPEPTGKKYELSKAIYESLLKNTGAFGRGLVKRPLLVVPRETKMPSCLVEMGFLSNADEEVKLQNSAYMQLQVQAIAKGIVDYLLQQGL